MSSLVTALLVNWSGKRKPRDFAAFKQTWWPQKPYHQTQLQPMTSYCSFQGPVRKKWRMRSSKNNQQLLTSVFPCERHMKRCSSHHECRMRYWNGWSGLTLGWSPGLRFCWWQIPCLPTCILIFVQPVLTIWFGVQAAHERDIGEMFVGLWWLLFEVVEWWMVAFLECYRMGQKRTNDKELTKANLDTPIFRLILEALHATLSKNPL